MLEWKMSSMIERLCSPRSHQCSAPSAATSPDLGVTRQHNLELRKVGTEVGLPHLAVPCPVPALLLSSG